MSRAKHMWNTAAATEHSTEHTSASERNLAADDAADTEHSRTAIEHSGQHQVANERWVFARQRQLWWAHVAGHLWKHGGLVIGLDGASGGFQGLVDDGDVVYVVGSGSLQMIDYFHGQMAMQSVF